MVSTPTANSRKKATLFGLLMPFLVLGYLYYALDFSGIYVFAFYLVILCVHYPTLFLRSPIGIIFPVAVLIFAKHADFIPLTLPLSAVGIAERVIGLSYLAFRLSYLAMEVRNGLVSRPSLRQYFGFAFFLPTFIVGPISSYSVYEKSLREFTYTKISFVNSIQRVIVGLAKFLFLANVFNQLTYSHLLTRGHSYSVTVSWVAVFSYYLYFYFNFSGASDVAIGLSGLLGMQVEENFDAPLLARNVKDFWSRWHITLTRYMRDLVFTPTSKFIVQRTGSHFANQAVVIPILLVFTLIGLWHGFLLNCILFGVIHGCAVVVNHWYGVLLKQSLGREALKRYSRNGFIRRVSVVFTFTFVALTFSLFASSLSDYVLVLNQLVP